MAKMTKAGTFFQVPAIEKVERYRPGSDQCTWRYFVQFGKCGQSFISYSVMINGMPLFTTSANENIIAIDMLVSSNSTVNSERR